MSSMLLDDYLKRLRLPTVARNYERVAVEADGNRVTYPEYLCSLLELEVQSRDDSRRKERLTRAKFPSLKTLDSFKFEEVPALDRKLILQLFKGQYMQKTENIVFIGPHGTGKSHLAIALGIQACQEGRQVKFFTVADLIHQLVEARDDQQLSKFKQKLARADLLILDELGMVDCKPDEANLLFQVVSSRYEQHSTIFTTNLEFSQLCKT